jgi:hypothetical protein
MLLVLVAVAACGGREVVDVDAETPDASFDIDAHWGECCDRVSGGLGRPCTAAEIEAGPYAWYQCPAWAYCGLQLDPFGINPPEIGCCGNKAVGPLNAFAEVQRGCPPWPGEVEASWGDCCYNQPPLDGGFAVVGGVRGACPPDGLSHTQCSTNQYCGAPFGGYYVYDGGPDFDAGDLGFRCCGDRNQDEGTMFASGLDPTCPPVYWKP